MEKARRLIEKAEIISDHGAIEGYKDGFSQRF